VRRRRLTVRFLLVLAGAAVNPAGGLSRRAPMDRLDLTAMAALTLGLVNFIQRQGH
jgi:hypothetical protein